MAPGGQQHCQDTCGFEHGVVCTKVEQLQKELDELKKSVETIENNRRAAWYFFIGNGISALAVLLTIYTVFVKDRNHEVHGGIPEKKRYDTVENYTAPRRYSVDSVGSESDRVR